MENPFDEVKFEKARAMLRYNHLRGLAKLLRVAEVAAAVLSLSWCLPPALSFLRSLSAFLATPVFFFLLCNAIILTLLANSGSLSRQLSDPSRLSISDSQFQAPEPDPPVVYQDKEMIPAIVAVGPTVEEAVGGLETPKSFRRSKSEVGCPETKCLVLRRSETEEEMSNEEFQRKIEEFIARQLRFRRQESTAGAVEPSSDS